MDTRTALLTRRSIRVYTDEAVAQADLDAIIEAGIHAPYGRNQIWRFAVLTDSGLINELAGLTIYKKFVSTAKALIVVFHDQDLGYHEIKDAQSMGACIQNMLLAVHACGLGAVWIGEILKNEAAVRALCAAPESYGLSAVLAIGHPGKEGVYEQRAPVDEVVFFRK